MSARRRLAAFAGGLTVAFGLFVGLVGGLVHAPLLGGHARLDPEHSGLAAVAGLRFVESVGYPAALALYLLLPVVVAVVSRRSDRVPLHPAWAVAAVAPALPTTVALLLTPFGVFDASQVPFLTGLIVIAVALLVAVLLLNEFARTGNNDGRTSPLVAFGNVAFVVLFVVGVAFGNLSAGPAGALVQQEGGQGVPNTQFDLSTNETADGTMLVITHDGGNAVETDKLNVTSTGTNLSDLDNGTAYCQHDTWGNTTWTGSELTAGDSCTVPADGLDDGDEIRVIWDSPYRRTTLANYEHES